MQSTDRRIDMSVLETIQRRTTRREFAKDVAISAAGLVLADSLDYLKAAETETKYKQYVYVFSKGGTFRGRN
jgi:hypothetical protein